MSDESVSPNDNQTSTRQAASESASQPAPMSAQPQLDSLAAKLAETGYVADPDLVASLHLMEVLQKPLLIEGEAGVGKTGIARALADIHGCDLIRLQCYEGLDAQHALYEWDYQRQLLALQLTGSNKNTSEDNLSTQQQIYSDDYLLKRPLLAAISSPTPVVLLIDEVDRADEEFEALLLETLSDFQVSVPELGTFKAHSIPRVILTSNAIRELSDALRRRCLYHYIDYPSARKELNIVRARLPGISEDLALQAVWFVQNLRRETLRKTPGVAETLDWAASLLAMKIHNLEDSLDVIDSTLASLVKTRADLLHLRSDGEVERIFKGNPAIEGGDGPAHKTGQESTS